MLTSSKFQLNLNGVGCSPPLFPRYPFVKAPQGAFDIDKSKNISYAFKMNKEQEILKRAIDGIDLTIIELEIIRNKKARIRNGLALLLFFLLIIAVMTMVLAQLMKTT